MAESKRETPAPSALQALVDDRLRGFGDGPAIIELTKDDRRDLSWKDLEARVKALARGLVEDGLERGDRVALLAANGPPWIAAALGIIRAGGVVVPLDVQLDSKTLQHALSDSGAGRLFTDSRRRDRVDELELDHPPRLWLLDADADDEEGWQTLLEADAGAGLPDLDAEDGAALFYTSGTTGAPKGVPLTHRNLGFQFGAIGDAGVVGSGDRVMVPLPLHHVYPFVVGMLLPMDLGIPIVLPAGITGPQVTRALREGKATVVVGVPRLYRALVEGIEAQTRARGRLAALLFRATLGALRLTRRHLGLKGGRRLLAPLHRRMGPQLRLAACGGAPLSPDLAWTLEGLGWDVAVGYGLTETSPLLTIRLPGRSRLDSVGRAIEGVEIRIDSDVEGADSAGTGEILARGPNVFAGYHNLPEETGKVLSDDGWFRTGDLGRLDRDGNLQVVGRVSTLIVTEGGKNIQPDELEDAYAEEDAIAEVGVLQQDSRLVALVVPAGGGDDAADRAREAVGRRARGLPSYQRVAHVAVTREALPRTRLGKIRRKELEERFVRAEGDDGEEREAKGPMAVEEMSGDDRTLLDEPAARHAWDWLAARYPDHRLTPDTRPGTDLGIDSMEWINLTMDMGEQVGVELDEEAIGRIDTVRDLLREVGEAGEGGARLDLKSAPAEQLGDAQRRWLEPLSPAADAFARVLHHLNRVLVRGLFRLRVEGLEHVPRDRQFLLAPSHASFLDPFVIAAALPWPVLRGLHWGGWTGAAFSNPLKRGFSRLARAVPVDPEQGVLSSLAFGAAVLKDGKGLVWFPEGERSASGELQDFRRGVGMLLESQPVTVVPAVIHGAHRAMPPGRWLPVPFRPVRVVFGAAVDTATLADEGKGDDDQQRIVHALHQRVADLMEGRAEAT